MTPPGRGPGGRRTPGALRLPGDPAHGPERARARTPAGARPWWLGAAVAAMGAVWLRGALSLPQTAAYAVVGPGLFVTLVGAGLVVLGLLLAVAALRGERFVPQDAEDTDPTRPPSRRALWTTAAAVAAAVLLVGRAGFPVTAALVFGLTARAFGSRRLLLDLAVGLALGTAAWLLFSRLLGVTLPGLPLGLAR